MPDEWLTLAETSERLGIAPGTVRRWIREGKLYAELRRGEHGSRYYVHHTQIDMARQIRDVVEITRPTIESLSRTFEQIVREREGNVVSVLGRLRAEDPAALLLQRAREAQSFEEMLAVQRDLLAAIEDLRHSEIQDAPSGEKPKSPTRRWWPFSH